jgi:hypothetical protein
MGTDTIDTATSSGLGPTDSGLRCPRCGYNLTGLTLPRCPECGATFDWEEVRRLAADRPTIAFERAGGWRKIPAFFVTWATVLFAPWIFARQIVQHVSWRHGFAFGAICFAGTSLAHAFDMEWEVQVAWLSAALACILVQALCLSLLDPALWRRPGQTLRFWLVAGCYTSAVMPTEAVVYGPPMLAVSDLLELVRGQWPGGSFSLFPFRSLSVESVVYALTMLVWLWGVLFCYHRRLRLPPRRRLPIAAAAVCAGAGLILLYAVVVEQVGVRVYELVK